MVVERMGMMIDTSVEGSWGVKMGLLVVQSMCFSSDVIMVISIWVGARCLNEVHLLRLAWTIHPHRAASDMGGVVRNV